MLIRTRHEGLFFVRTSNRTAISNSVFSGFELFIAFIGTFIPTRRFLLNISIANCFLRTSNFRRVASTPMVRMFQFSLRVSQIMWVSWIFILLRFPTLVYLKEIESINCITQYFLTTILRRVGGDIYPEFFSHSLSNSVCQPNRQPETQYFCNHMGDIRKLNNRIVTKIRRLLQLGTMPPYGPDTGSPVVLIARAPRVMTIGDRRALRLPVNIG